MTDEEIRATVLRLVGDIAPEADLAHLRPDAIMREELDLDSMDVLNLMIAFHDALGVDVPEADYGKLATLNAAVAYLAAARRSGEAAAAAATTTTARAHRFEGELHWTPGAQGVAATTHVVDFPGRARLEVSTAPSYGGDPAKLNPEELFLAAVASCQLLTYLSVARRAGVEVRRYDDRPVATLAIADKRMRITDVLLRPRIVVATERDVGLARELVERAHDGCFVARSVSCAVRTEPEILAEAAAPG